MAITKAKENILKRIRQALSHSVPLPFPQSEGPQSPFAQVQEDTAVIFAERFSSVQGRFGFCSDKDELVMALQNLIRQQGWTKIFLDGGQLTPFLQDSIPPYPDLSDCEAAITSCECLVARTGSIVLSAKEGGRSSSIYCPVHVCIAFTHQLLPDLKDALLFLKNKYPAGLPSSISFATGPSRTADIEKTLVTGVHGPKEVYCFLVDSAS
jgi:L-lactate dehydrogenase complex protein LldG